MNSSARHTTKSLDHSGEYFTDGKIHDVGVGSDEDHAPENVAGEGPLSPSQLSDLVEYLKSL